MTSFDNYFIKVMLMFIAFITIWNMLRSHTKHSNTICFIIAIIVAAFTSICQLLLITLFYHEDITKLR